MLHPTPYDRPSGAVVREFGLGALKQTRHEGVDNVTRAHREQATCMGNRQVLLPRTISWP